MDNVESNSLCLECGMCCNGVIFADVQLQSKDDADHLRGLGLAFITKKKFRQPCAALEGCRCRIYSQRPKYCREFECLLLQNTLAGRMNVKEARRIIGTAHERVKRVQQLLHELGDTDEQVALSKRFHQTKRRIECNPMDDETADKFGELTLAVHDLNVLLSEAFYPGAGG